MLPAVRSGAIKFNLNVLFILSYKVNIRVNMDITQVSRQHR